MRDDLEWDGWAMWCLGMRIDPVKRSEDGLKLYALEHSMSEKQTLKAAHTVKYIWSIVEGSLSTN
ncbi:hypothetical protein H4218_005242 [Coemansia sp. IMI 209128]|nr:hypothetical protein H4218_005242 [Coemansia sp. IMI 209128]